MLNRLLPKGSSLRTIVFSIGALLLLLLFALFGLPKPTPPGIIVFGLVVGAQDALLAAGIILIFRSARIINFSAAVLGGVGATMMFNFAGLLEWPFVISLIIGLLTATVFGLLVEVIFVQRFFNAPRLALTVVTIVLATTIEPAKSMIASIPIFPDPRDAGVDLKLQTGKIPLPFESFKIELFPFRFGFAEVFTIVTVFLAFAGLALFFKYSKQGARVRGASENSDRALMMGINVRLLSTMVWGIAAFLAGLSAITSGMTFSFSGAGSGDVSKLLPALAGAVIGRMRNLPVTVFAMLGIGILQQSVSWSFPETTVLDLLMLVILAGGLILQRKKILRGEEDASSWEATKEIRPTPRELTAVPSIRRMRRILMGLGLIVLIVFPLATSPAQINLAGLIAIYAIVALSLVVLTGWGGQVSLGQFGLVAVAAVVGGKLTSDLHITFWIALPLVCAFMAGFAALVGLPALRVKGIFLAVTTLAFAAAVQNVLFNESYFGWLLPDRIERPRFFFLSFGNERNYYYLTVAFALLAALMVKRLRSARTGRVLLALREDEKGVQAFGINLVRTRVAVFALSGVLAGLAGMLFVHHQRAIDAGSFEAKVSVEMFIMAMIGGITSVSGALLGAIYIGMINFFLTNPTAKTLAGAGGLLLLLIFSPGGLSALLYQARDGLLRIIASRRQIIVPSLFEDYDPEAIARRKVPFAPRSEGEGIDRIPLDRRYAQKSELYLTQTEKKPTTAAAPAELGEFEHPDASKREELAAAITPAGGGSG